MVGLDRAQGLCTSSCSIAEESTTFIWNGGPSGAVLLKVQPLQYMYNVQETYCSQVKAQTSNFLMLKFCSTFNTPALGAV